MAPEECHHRSCQVWQRVHPSTATTSVDGCAPRWPQSPEVPGGFWPLHPGGGPVRLHRFPWKLFEERPRDASRLLPPHPGIIFFCFLFSSSSSISSSSFSSSSSSTHSYHRHDPSSFVHPTTDHHQQLTLQLIASQPPSPLTLGVDGDSPLAQLACCSPIRSVAGSLLQRRWRHRP